MGSWVNEWTPGLMVFVGIMFAGAIFASRLSKDSVSNKDKDKEKH
ncbi:hypothetical protein [Lonepinella sp. BR2271]